MSKAIYNVSARIAARKARPASQPEQRRGPLERPDRSARETGHAFGPMPRIISARLDASNHAYPNGTDQAEPTARLAARREFVQKQTLPIGNATPARTLYVNGVKRETVDNGIAYYAGMALGAKN